MFFLQVRKDHNATLPDYTLWPHSGDGAVAGKRVVATPFR
jgi:hypothetical protein